MPALPIKEGEEYIPPSDLVNAHQLSCWISESVFAAPEGILLQIYHAMNSPLYQHHNDATVGRLIRKLVLDHKMELKKGEARNETIDSLA